MLQGSTESPYFSQILKAHKDDIKFLGGSALLQYLDDLLLCSPSQASSQKDSIHLPKLLGTYGHQRKITVYSNPGLILRASDISTKALRRSRYTS